MKTWLRGLGLAGVVLAALSFAACIGVRVEHVDDPEPVFDRAEREIAALERDPGRGPADRLKVLAYGADDGELVRVSVPLWIVEAALDLGLRGDRDRGDDGDLRGRYDLEWTAVRDIGRFGPGLLVSVEGEDDRVLVWLK